MENTIEATLGAYLEQVGQARSQHTHNTYRNALNLFSFVLTKHDLPPSTTSISDFPEDAITWLIAELHDYAPATERLYITAATNYYQFLAAERLAEINLPRLKLIIKQRARRPGQRLPQFPRNEIDNVIEYAINLVNNTIRNEPQELLRDKRDGAFILTLADTGLRVHEACALRRGDIDWMEAHALVIGKGNQQAVVRFSQRSLQALREYISRRSELDGKSGRPLPSLPLFARHDKGAGTKIKPITTTTGRNIISHRVGEALGESALGRITPHSFRHYFVTKVLVSSGGNLKLAQELARHRNIAVTQRYAHLSDNELDRGYHDIFNS